MLAFVVGTMVGGLTSAAFLVIASGLLSWVPEFVRTGALVVVVLVLVGHEADRWHLDLPENRRQIPQEVFRRRNYWAGALQFGFELGTGVRTFVPNVAPYALAMGIILVPPPVGVALVAGVLFGVGRSIVVAVGAAAPRTIRRVEGGCWRSLGQATVLAGATVVIGSAVIGLD